MDSKAVDLARPYSGDECVPIVVRTVVYGVDLERAGGPYVILSIEQQQVDA
jgi:hypothetical protein